MSEWLKPVKSFTPTLMPSMYGSYVVFVMSQETTSVYTACKSLASAFHVEIIGHV